MPRRLIELHVHLEGSLPPPFLLHLADRHGLSDVPAACLVPAGDAYRRPRDLADFLQIFKAVSAVLRTPADHHEAALAAADVLADRGVVYAEMTVAYGVLQKRGVDPLPVQRALAEAAAEVEERRGLKLRWLPDAVRQWGPDAAWRALEAAVSAGLDLGVVGFGLGGDETALPAGDFAGHFRDARREGLGVACHAGETGDPVAVRDAVAAGVDRIGHALGAAADPDVLALLRDAAVHAELCPGSNAATGALARRADHPLRAFLDAGVACSLHTDDPQLFGLDLPGEYAAATAELGATEDEVAAMLRAAAAASFAEPAVKDELQAES